MTVMERDVVEVRPGDPHRVWLRFQDGAAGEVDVAALLRFEGIFEPLRDPAWFARVRIHRVTKTIAWPNGADICKDVLYAAVTGAPLPGAT